MQKKLTAPAYDMQKSSACAAVLDYTDKFYPINLWENLIPILLIIS